MAPPGNSRKRVISPAEANSVTKLLSVKKGHTMLSLAAMAVVMAVPFPATGAQPKEMRVMARGIAPRVRLVDDADFFAAWSLDTIGMEAVRTAVEAGEYTTAKRELKAYFLGRREPTWKINHWEMPTKPRGPAKRHSRYAEGERILEHKFSGGGFEVDFGDKIEWNHFPLKFADGKPDTEYPLIHYINRFGHLNRTLGPLYWYSHDERYAAEFTYEVTDHVLSNPAPENYRAHTAVWSRLTSCVPLSGSWVDAYNYFLPSRTFTPEAHAVMLKGFIEKARYAIRNPDGVNRYMAQLRGIFITGAFFPELKQAEAFRDFAIRALCATAVDEFYPDGFSKELCPGYHGGSAGILRGIVLSARKMGYDAPQALVNGIKSPYDVFVKLATPARQLPMFGDTWGRGNVKKTLAGALTVLDKPEFRWIVTDGSKGSPPSFTSVAFPWAGYRVMRSGWDRNARYLCFDAAPLGVGHWHEDSLNFECHAYGEPLITEVGIYSYTMSKWSRYFYSSLAHNVVIVDGLGQNRACELRKNAAVTSPKTSNWYSDDDIDIASGFYNGMWGDYADCDRWRNAFGRDKAKSLATHRRDICFVKDDYWVVSDRLTAEGTHTYEQLFHFEANRVLRLPKAGVAMTDNPERANIAIIQADAMVGKIIEGRDEPPQGWESPKQGERRPAPVVVFEQTASGGCIYDTVLYPTPPNKQRTVQVERVPVTTADGTPIPPAEVCALRITTDRGTDLYVNDLRVLNVNDVSCGVKVVDGVTTDARVIVVRLDGEGNVLKIRAVAATVFQKRDYSIKD